jgi:hypothetical protein
MDRRSRAPLNLYARTMIFGPWRSAMLDFILVMSGFGFFFVAILYTVACDRL